MSLTAADFDRDDRIARLASGVARLLGLAAIASLFAVSDMLLYDWGFHYADTGGNALQKVHPGTWLAALALLVQAANRGNPLRIVDDFLGSRAIVIYLFGVAVLLVFTIRIRNAPFTPWIDTFVLPALLYALIQTMSAADKRRGALIIHALMTANALLALYESQTGYRLTTYVAGEFIIEGDWRSTALLGHPLANALATGTYTMAILFGGGRELRAWRRPLAIGLQLLALAAFGGRTALVLTLLALALTLVYKLVLFLRGARIRLLHLGLLFLVLPLISFVTAAAFSGGLFDRLLERFADDNGSASARVSMLQLFDYIPWDGLVFGPDPTLIGPLQYLLGIEYGIESFWIGFIMLNGLVVSFIFFFGLAAFSWKIAAVTRPATYILLVYFYLIASTSVSMSSKTLSLGLFVAAVLILMRRDAMAGAPQRPTGIKFLPPKLSRLDRTGL